MADDETDWNAYLAERLAMQRAERAEKLAAAREAAPADKEPFDVAAYRALYERRNSIDIDRSTPWETLLAEAEYDYYVTYSHHMTLDAFLQHQIWLQGWG